ncbi:MAG TPA: ribonuclease H-like domain-containing protein [Methylomirabilota bacterium]|nr:ribonuclease H-like domain-containing protein [Methylomirabilota bacterium]
MSSLAEASGRAGLDELRRIIRRIEASRPLRATPEPLEHVVGGELVDTPAGRLVTVRREFPLTHHHGRWALAHALEASPVVLRLIGRAEEAPAQARNLLFLDTETTGLAGGTGTYAFLVGVGYEEADRFIVVQFFMRDFDEEPALLTALEPLLQRASGIVTYNGSGFDVPLLETRFVMARRRWPATLGHLDLLRPCRRVWAPRLADCRLHTLEREVLGLVREDDVPGALIPTLYFEFLKSRRAAPLARVFSHNRADILSLAGLLGWFTRALADDPGLDARPEELAGLGRLWERQDRERSAGYYRAALDAGLDGPQARWVRLRLALWEKRLARWDAACALWKAVAGADRFDPEPWQELAKYHEHRRRDFATARRVVLEALDQARRACAAPALIQDLMHRLSRLERRLGAVEA